MPPNTTGDNGPAADAQIDGPRAVAVDKSGDLYVYQQADEWKGISKVAVAIGAIRKIDGVTQRINTLMVGCDPRTPPSGRNACLGVVGQLQIAPSGELLFSEFWDRRLRAFDVASRRFSLIAGNGKPESTGDGGPATEAGVLPYTFAVDAGGDTFIGESSYRIRRVDAKTGVVSSVVGNGVHGFAGDGGPALQARIGLPTSLAVDQEGNLYIADDVSGRIRQVSSSTGLIQTIGGNGKASFDAAEGAPAKGASIGTVAALAIDPDGNVLFATGGRICRISRTSGILTTIAGTGGNGSSGDGGPATRALIEPSAFAVDSRGNVFIAEYENNRIRRVDAKTGVIATVGGNGLPHRAPAPVY